MGLVNQGYRGELVGAEGYIRLAIDREAGGRIGGRKTQGHHAYAGGLRELGVYLHAHYAQIAGAGAGARTRKISRDGGAAAVINSIGFAWPEGGGGNRAG